MTAGWLTGPPFAATCAAGAVVLIVQPSTRLREPVHLLVLLGLVAAGLGGMLSLVDGSTGAR